MTTDKQQIKDRAHAIWEAEGRPHGRAEDHWHQAERELGMPGSPLSSTESAANGGAPALPKTRKAATPKAAAPKAAAPKTVRRTKKASA